ncbi:erythromycin esterase family protein [Streptomyces sp. NPDC055186]
MPIEDLHPLGKAADDTVMAGIGEAAHGSRDFVTFRHRSLRYPVERKSFRSFAPEAGWSTGARLDHRLLTGRGDPARIMSEEFQNAHLLPHSQEYPAMIRRMRACDVAHPEIRSGSPAATTPTPARSRTTGSSAVPGAPAPTR